MKLNQFSPSFFLGTAQAPPAADVAADPPQEDCSCGDKFESGLNWLGEKSMQALVLASPPIGLAVIGGTVGAGLDLLLGTGGTIATCVGLAGGFLGGCAVTYSALQ